MPNVHADVAQINRHQRRVNVAGEGLVRGLDEQIFKCHYLPALHEPEQDVLPFEFASQARWRATWK